MAQNVAGNNSGGVPISHDSDLERGKVKTKHAKCLYSLILAKFRVLGRYLARDLGPHRAEWLEI